MPVTELYAFNLICENLLAALYGVALNDSSKFYGRYSQSPPQSQAKRTADTRYVNARPQMSGAAVKGVKQSQIKETNRTVKAEL